MTSDVEILRIFFFHERELFTANQSTKKKKKPTILSTAWGSNVGIIFNFL